ncbi:TonB-dependent siderophore receptor [Janthinobacterium agaricidamnosum]|uniref:TonB-dependent siderophore receptor family protein n=1 Tax=Janthinobacterium agaricidamnosum NBRC 102515 = DSM 9628 TaxID=1349767 RepID=W0V514_9BURK|nr:TonB-dependent siderophore receptor [Janthinobacterium agaricidamnosum]CDG82367.1 tonB-dependent siderophore receptor family protein [Janthinobacterium agaricidamnosum NBRC 102515 = DSM 9628]
MKTTTNHLPPPFPRRRLALALHWALLGIAAPVLAQTAAPADKVLGEIKVQGARDKQSATGPVIGYHASRSAVGTKTDTPLNEVAQSISVVTADQIQDTGARTLQDALGYTPGVSAEQGSYGALSTESFMIRGFEVQPFSGGILRDGMKYQPNVYNGAQEPYGLERIEVLKGASSLLYGTGAPGGVINTVSKRPSADMLKELNLTLGSKRSRQLAADYGGALDAAGVWTYRLTGLAREGDSVVDFGYNERSYFAPALTWRPSAATSLTLLSSYQHSKVTDNGNLPIKGTLQFNPNGQLPVGRYLGEPGFNYFDNTQKNIGYVYTHAFSDALTLTHGLRYFRSDLDYKYYQILGVEDDQRTVRRRGRAFRDNTNALTTDTNLAWKVTTGAVAHTILAGVDYLSQHHDSDRANTAFAPIDAYAPVYGTAPQGVTPTDMWRLRQYATGLYLQDQLKFGGQWVLLLGGRHDSTRQDQSDLLTGPDKVIQRDSANTGRAGLVYLGPNGVSPYVSFSQSFAPEQGNSRTGAQFKPTRGEQYEAGVRYQPAGGTLLLSAALYQLTQTNVQTPDPVAPDDYSVQTGEVRSRGLELEAKGSPLRDLELVAAYSYIDAKTTKTNNPDELGARQISVPRNTASLWLHYRLAGLGAAPLQAGAGLRYVGERPGNIFGVPPEPAYTLLDTVLSYDLGHWKYALNVNNLADKRYVPSPCYGRGCTYGQPRTVALSASYRW